MATLNKGQTFGVTETITNSKLHNLVDLATISAIVNDDIDNNAAIADSKLGTISTSGKVNGIAISNLASIPAGAGVIPSANIPDALTSFSSLHTQDLLVSSIASVQILNVNNLRHTNASIPASQIYNLASLPSTEIINYNNIVSSLASGAIPIYDGSNNFVGSIAGNTSNIIFSWSDVSDAGTVTHNDVTYETRLRFRFRKISGISTVTIQARMWSEAGSTTGYLNVDIGGANNNVNDSSADTPTWVTSANIDVSGLTNGTTYDGIVQIKNSSGDASYCSAVTLIAS